MSHLPWKQSSCCQLWLGRSCNFQALARARSGDNSSNAGYERTFWFLCPWRCGPPWVMPPLIMHFNFMVIIYIFYRLLNLKIEIQHILDYWESVSRKNMTRLLCLQLLALWAVLSDKLQKYTVVLNNTLRIIFGVKCICWISNFPL